MANPNLKGKERSQTLQNLREQSNSLHDQIQDTRGELSAAEQEQHRLEQIAQQIGNLGDELSQASQ